MLRKISKLCLVAAFAACLSIPAQAAETKASASGEVSFGLTMKTEDDSNTDYSYWDMETTATLALEGSVEVGQWTTTGAVDFDIEKDEFISNNKTITIENKTISIGMGYYEYDVDELSIGGSYLDIVDESVDFGVLAFEEAGHQDYIKVGIKEVGLQFALGINDMEDGESYTETTLAAMYQGEFDALAINAAINSVTESIDDERSAGLEEGEHDGKSKTELALGVGYTLEEMVFALNIDQYVEESGEDNAEEKTYLGWELAFDFGLGDDSGISVMYSAATEDWEDDGDEDTDYTAFNIGYMRQIAGATFTIGYALKTEENDDTNKDDTESIFGGGLTFAF
jgi:hypothetical protein